MAGGCPCRGKRLGGNIRMLTVTRGGLKKNRDWLWHKGGGDGGASIVGVTRGMDWLSCLQSRRCRYIKRRDPCSLPLRTLVRYCRRLTVYCDVGLLPQAPSLYNAFVDGWHRNCCWVRGATAAMFSDDRISWTEKQSKAQNWRAGRPVTCNSFIRFEVKS